MTPQIPNYEIKRVLGEGGMAVVYLAEHRLLHQEVAIKVLNKEYCYNSNIKKRFLDEGRKLARLQHENIVRVINLTEQEDTVAIVMEKIEGVTLKELLESYGKLELNEIANFLKQMTNALGYVHDQGYVHRDIKPSNFMITNEGKVKLLDFGIAKDMRGNMEYTITGTNQQMGTLLYMSPEQVNEVKLVDKQTDIYSLGVVLWQLVSGKKPYSGMTLSKHQIEIKIVNEPLSPTNSILDGVISKATAKQTENRYVTCAQLWGDMERIFIKEKIILDNETTIIENPGKKEKKKQPFNWVLLLFVLIIVSCVGFIIWKKAIFFPEEEKQELSSIPTIETVPVFSIFQRDALSGGTISSDGGSEILEKGIVWSTNQNPDISLSTKTNEGGNSSNFNSTISNLLPGTRYYVRAYATNSVGTEYGQEQTFMTEKEAVVFSGSVSIGSQVWQTKNLNVDRFRNGDPIPEARTKEEWVTAGKKGEPAWCYYENNASNSSIYGKLYNWYATTDSRGICPPGWHLPSDKEWTTLTIYLGGKDVAGGKMKSTGTAYWNSPNTDATNESGFSALPGGYRGSGGSFFVIRNYAFFWSATEYASDYAWGRSLSNYNGVVDRNASYNYKSFGASVRCLKD